MGASPQKRVRQPLCWRSGRTGKVGLFKRGKRACQDEQDILVDSARSGQLPEAVGAPRKGSPMRCAGRQIMALNAFARESYMGRGADTNVERITCLWGTPAGTKLAWK